MPVSEEKEKAFKDSLQRLRAKSRDLQIRSAVIRKRASELCRASYSASPGLMHELDLLRALGYVDEPPRRFVGESDVDNSQYN
jgi:hypothetical protein